MSDEILIKVDRVSKKYCKSLKQSMVYGMSDIARNMVGMGSAPETLRKNEFWAVNDVSFELRRGETLGLIGSNGSGKTSLLKMLNGIFWPDKGEINIRGRVGALIAVGAGFHPILTGRENIYVNGAILGMTKSELDKKFDEIVEFADIGDFLDTPVKYYSSGMFVRLGFAVAIHCNPDILLVDEVLAVGDINFQRKCLDKIKELKEGGTATILVSHNLLQIETSCNRSVFMDYGVMRAFGETKSVLSTYVDHENKKALTNNSGPGLSLGTNEVVIKKTLLLNKEDQPADSFYPFDDLKFKIEFFAKKKIKKPNFIVIVNYLGSMRVLVSNTKVEENSPASIDGHGYAVCSINRVALLPNNYSVDIYIKDDEHGLFYDVKKNMVSFTIKVPQGKEMSYRASGDMGIVPVKGEWVYGK
ncbi:MAG: ABC transporter ATP-binding protein [Candidatus Omnitrophica bacterium]|nr:ABC transporter ATP-binding protein [Candidatus Omnitrophota bacterium]